MPYYTRKGTSKKDKGKICVYKKDDNTKVGCTAGPIEKYLAALHTSEKINESDDFDWLKEPIQIKYGDLMENLQHLFKVGDTVYLTGGLALDMESSRFISLNNTVAKVDSIEDKRLKVSFGKDITDLPIWQSEMSSNFVHLGDVPQDNQIMVVFPEKRINESEDFEWVSDIGSDIEKFIQELSKLIKEHVPTAEIELDWDTTSDGGEYFGKVWLYDRFYELYMYDKTFVVRFYALDPETDEYYFYQEYRNLPKTRLLTILLNDMISVSNKNLNESEEGDFDWAKDIEPKTSYEDQTYLRNFDSEYVRNPEDVKVGDLLQKWNGHAIYRVEKIEEHDVDGFINTLAGIDLDKDVVYRVRNVITNKPSIIQLYKKIGVSYPSRRPIYRKQHLYKLILRDLNESEGEFDWVRNVETDLIPGEIYDIKTSNNYYWIPEKYIGREWDDEYQVEFYKFKDLDGGGSGGKSVPYVKDLIEKGNIRPYDPNWSIKDELIFSDNIEDALKGNFVIYFKDGVYLDQTLPIQDKLFEMGFSFYTKGPNEYITNEDSPKKIQFFESFNWDTNNPRYSKMPSDQWDIKKVLLSSVGDDKGIWRRSPNPRLEEQELFLTVKDHKAIVINGDKYITQNIGESEEDKDGLNWIRDVKPSELSLSPNVFFRSDDEMFYTLDQLGFDIEDMSVDTMAELAINCGYRWSEENNGWYNRDEVIDINTLKESEEFDWIQKQEPEKELSKSKRYVIDVSNLRPAPMIHSHDTSLTKQDILRKLEDLGYDVEHIDVDAAKYFYVEPTEGGPSWQYDEYDTPIPYDYWVDYNTDLMDDPSYGGKYQMINVDEFMFLIDNNLIGESESKEDGFNWVRNLMADPISVCEAADVLSVGDNIMINNLLEFAGDNERRDVNAEILAIDYLQQIQPDNKSNLKTILVHINDDYLGFGRLWVESFKDEYIDKCLDGRCMFLICGDKDFNDTTITPMSSDLLESKKTINEVAGISFESRKWADIIYDEIISNPEEKTRLIIDGYDHQEAFNGFPIDYIVIDYYDKITGYGQEHSGYDKDGNYVVLLYVQPQLVRGQGGYSLKSALNHEMKHAWEDYNRLSKGLPSIEQTKESKQLYNRDFILLMSDNNITGPIKDILKYYYYLSSLETSPYLENVYDGNPAYENMVRQIATKDFESFKNRFDLDINWHLINMAYNIPFVKKFKSPRDFIDYSAEELRSRANKVIKKINKMKYIHNKI